MKSPSITAVLTDGKWSVSYVGDDADAAKKAFTASVNANADGAMLFIRPEYTRRFKGGAKAQQPAKDEPKGKGKK